MERARYGETTKTVPERQTLFAGRPSGAVKILLGVIISLIGAGLIAVKMLLEMGLESISPGYEMPVLGYLELAGYGLFALGLLVLLVLVAVWVHALNPGVARDQELSEDTRAGIADFARHWRKYSESAFPKVINDQGHSVYPGLKGLKRHERAVKATFQLPAVSPPGGRSDYVEHGAKELPLVCNAVSAYVSGVSKNQVDIVLVFDDLNEAVRKVGQ